MNITYLLDQPDLGGGTKVVFQHAELLARRGHEVTVLGRGARPNWVTFSGAYLDLGSGVPELPPQDLVLATFWTTLTLAAELDLGPVGHFCQGYEGDWPHLAEERELIEEAYEERVPTITVTPHLAESLERRFGRRCRVVPPPVDPRFAPRRRLGPHCEPWIVVPGIFEAEIKGVRHALEAIRLLEAGGRRCRLLRISVRKVTTEENLLRPAERFLAGVSPEEVAAALAASDLLLFPSMPGEGFGLPLLEALASGVPAVASRLPGTEYQVGGAGDAVPLVPPGEPGALATAAEELLGSIRRWRLARRRGLARAARFAGERVAGELEAALVWAAGEAERRSPRLAAAVAESRAEVS